MYSTLFLLFWRLQKLITILQHHRWTHLFFTLIRDVLQQKQIYVCQWLTTSTLVSITWEKACQIYRKRQYSDPERVISFIASQLEGMGRLHFYTGQLLNLWCRWQRRQRARDTSPIHKAQDFLEIKLPCDKTAFCCDVYQKLKIAHLSAYCIFYIFWRKIEVVLACAN